MDDKQIIQLFLERSQSAIKETNIKYGNRLRNISFNIVKNREDAEECLNDTYLAAWNSIPPKEPEFLFSYLARIAKYISLGRYDYSHAKKRNIQLVELTQELEKCFCVSSSNMDYTEEQVSNVINTFLRSLEYEKRVIFVRRYWYADSIADISEKTGYSQNKIKSINFRTRNKLKKYLEKEGIYL